MMIYYIFDREDGVKFLNFIYPPSVQQDWIKSLFSDSGFTTVQISVCDDKIKEVYFGQYATEKFFDRSIFHAVISGIDYFNISFKSVSRDYNLGRIGL
jgi:hypothetical protein